MIGYGTERDVDKCKEYLMQSSEGKQLLASAYIVGFGVPVDFFKAYELDNSSAGSLIVRLPGTDEYRYVADIVNPKANVDEKD